MKVLVTVFGLLALGMGAVVAFHERPERGQGAGAAAPASDPGLAVQTISTGERVAIERHATAKGVTIVEFTADF